MATAPRPASVLPAKCSEKLTALSPPLFPPLPRALPPAHVSFSGSLIPAKLVVGHGPLGALSLVPQFGVDQKCVLDLAGQFDSFSWWFWIGTKFWIWQSLHTNVRSDGKLPFWADFWGQWLISKESVLSTQQKKREKRRERGSVERVQVGLWEMEREFCFVPNGPHRPVMLLSLDSRRCLIPYD